MSQALADDVLAEINRIAKAELQHDAPVLAHQSLKADLQLDSMAMIVVAVGLENRFRVKLAEEDAGELVTVADLVQLVCRRIAEGSA